MIFKIPKDFSIYHEKKATFPEKINSQVFGFGMTNEICKLDNEFGFILPAFLYYL